MSGVKGKTVSGGGLRYNPNTPPAGMPPHDRPRQTSSAAFLACERIRLEREHEFTQKGMRSIFDVGIPPRVLPGDPGHSEHVVDVKRDLDFTDRALYLRNPELVDVPHAPVSIETDSSESDGLILQCKTHLKVWEEPCLVRLSDVLKKTAHFSKKEVIDEFKRYQVDAINLPHKGVFERHYLMPAAHTELNDCRCMYCIAASETASSVLEIGYTGESIVDYLLMKVTERTRIIFISEIRLAFQEESRSNLVDRIVSGFRSAVPLIVAMSFEKFFRRMYEVGIEFAYELLKLLAPLIRHEWNYNAAIRLLNFWIEVHNRLSVVISAISGPLHAFEWKLSECHLNFRIFFWQFITHFVYELEEFQTAFGACLDIVARERKCWGAPRIEFSNQELIDCVKDVNTTLVNAKTLWERRVLPFDFEETKVPKWNVFRILQVRNPYKPLQPNQQEAYHVVECPKTGNQLYRRLDNESFRELEIADPILDVVFAKPGAGNNGPRFNIRVFKRVVELSASETQDGILNCDVPFLNAHGVKTVYKSSGARYIQEVYLKRRKDYNLDQVEGPLSHRLQNMLACTSREESREMIRPFRTPRYVAKRKKVLCYPQHVRELVLVRGQSRKRRTIVRHERRKPKARYYYRFGDIRYKKPDPAVTLFAAQRADFLTEALSAAFMSATNGLNPLGDDHSVPYKYYVVVCYVKKEEEDSESKKKSALKPLNNERRIFNMKNLLFAHYDKLEKYDLMTVAESLNASQPIEKDWARMKQHALDIAEEETSRKARMSQRTPVAVASSPSTPTMATSDQPGPPRGVHMVRGSQLFKMNDGRRSSEPSKMPSSGEPLRSNVTLAGDGNTNLSDQYTVGVRHHVGGIPFAHLEPDGIRGMRTSVGRPVSHEMEQEEQPFITQRERPVAVIKIFDGEREFTLDIEIEDDELIDEIYHTVSNTAAAAAAAAQHQNNQQHPQHQQHPPLQPHPHSHHHHQPQRKAPGKGLPVNSGYAKTRQHLREKLKREKSQAQQQLQQGQAKTAVTVPVTPPDPQAHDQSHGTAHNICNNAVVKQKKPSNEIVTTNNNPLGSGNLDDLVQLIEGLGVSQPPKPTASTEVDPRKAAKKARQKEKKEIQRQAEEAENKAEEERQRALEEEEKLRREEEERAEEARKKREKKKRRKKSKKEEAQAQRAEESTTESDTKERVATAAPSGAQQKASLAAPVLESVASTTKSEPADSTPRKSSEMVTIRRHSTAPDTTVTISVKSETGDEDLLYTLVNGQVLTGSSKKTVQNERSLPTETPVPAKAAGCNGNTTEVSASKKKKKKKKGKVEESHSVVQSETDSSGDDAAMMPPPGAGLYNPDHNMIVMNPDYNDDDDELAGYNSDDYYYGRRQPGQFEEVVSSKTKRQRIKANKGEEADLEKHSNGVAEQQKSRDNTPALTSIAARGGKRVNDNSARPTKTGDSSKKSAKSGYVKSATPAYVPVAVAAPVYVPVAVAAPKPPLPAARKFKFPETYAPKAETMAPRLIKARQEAQLQHQQQQYMQPKPLLPQTPKTPAPDPAPARSTPSPTYKIIPLHNNPPRYDYPPPREVAFQPVQVHEPTAKDTAPFQYYSRMGDILRAPQGSFNLMKSPYPVPETFQAPAGPTAGDSLSAPRQQQTFQSFYSGMGDTASGSLGGLSNYSQQKTAYGSPQNSFSLSDTNSSIGDVADFDKAISRPTNTQSPASNLSTDHATPTRELGGFNNSYNSNWSWPKTSSPDYVQKPYSPTPQVPVKQFQQPSPLGYQQPLDQIYRAQSTTQQQRAGLSVQQIPSFEACLSSMNRDKISRPEPLHGNSVGPWGGDFSAANKLPQNLPSQSSFPFGRSSMDGPTIRQQQNNPAEHPCLASADYYVPRTIDYTSRPLAYQQQQQPPSQPKPGVFGNTKVELHSRTRPRIPQTSTAQDSFNKFGSIGAIGYNRRRGPLVAPPAPNVNLFPAGNKAHDNRLMLDMLNKTEALTRVPTRVLATTAQNQEFPRPVQTRSPEPMYCYEPDSIISPDTEAEIREMNRNRGIPTLGPFINLANVNRNQGSANRQNDDEQKPITNQYTLF